jgi:hypothetical protein
MVLFLVLTAVTFSLLGFIIGIWADGFEKLQFIPTLIITPLTFLGGSFYSIDDAAAVLAEGERCSTGGLPRERLPLELSTASPTMSVALSLGYDGPPSWRWRSPRRRVWIFRTGLPAEDMR